MCMVDDADGWEFYSERQVKAARKAHRCEECGRTIAVGEPYRYAVGRYDGYVGDYHHCRHCEAAGEWLVVACNGYLFGGVLADLQEHTEHPELDSPLLRALIEGILAGWHGGADPVPDKAAVRASVPTIARSPAFA